MAVGAVSFFSLVSSAVGFAVTSFASRRTPNLGHGHTLATPGLDDRYRVPIHQVIPWASILGDCRPFASVSK